MYKCYLRDEACSPFEFDNWGNVMGGGDAFAYTSARKDEQWLGAAMDGSADDDTKFVVCAPRRVSGPSDDYLLHGICYWTSNTSQTQHPAVHSIAALRMKSNQAIVDKLRPGNSTYYYAFGEQGVSVHITDDGEEILIGAPGIYNWKGSVVRHRTQDSLESETDIPDPTLWGQRDDSYFGYAVSSGSFDGSRQNQTLYVASAPRANELQGEAYIFDIVKRSNGTTIQKYYTFSGEQYGEYFGYALITDDFNNDGLTDIAISAPLNSKNGSHENGVVYIYRNKGSAWNFAFEKTLESDYDLDGRFGSSLAKIGDINRDGYNGELLTITK